MPMNPPTPRSICWRGARSAGCRNISGSSKFDVNVEQRYNANGQRVTVAMAVVKVDVAGEKLISAAEGNGPVNALDVALRKDLGKYQKYIEGLKLIDYRVRILNGGTEAVTRVLIESEDENGRKLDHRRRVAQYHRRLVPGADGFGHLQAGEVGRVGVIASDASISRSGLRLSGDAMQHDRPRLRRRQRSRTLGAFL